jgi:hypothetical protein
LYLCISYFRKPPLNSGSKTIKDGVEVYNGSASGNNTGGTVLGFYDTINNELAVFANTNCGSDN